MGVIDNRFIELALVPVGVAAAFVTIRIAGRQRNVAREPGHRLRVLLLVAVGHAGVVGRQAMIGIESERRLVILEGAIVASLHHVGVAAVVKAIGIGRRLLHVHVVVGNGLVPLLLVAPVVAAVVVGQRVTWIEADGIVVVGHGALFLALVGVDIAPRVQRAGKVRLQLQGLIQILQSQVVFLFVTVGNAAVEIGAGQIGG